MTVQFWHTVHIDSVHSCPVCRQLMIVGHVCREETFFAVLINFGHVLQSMSKRFVTQSWKCFSLHLLKSYKAYHCTCLSSWGGDHWFSVHSSESINGPVWSRYFRFCAVIGSNVSPKDEFCTHQVLLTDRTVIFLCCIIPIRMYSVYSEGTDLNVNLPTRFDFMKLGPLRCRYWYVKAIFHKFGWFSYPDHNAFIFFWIFDSAATFDPRDDGTGLGAARVGRRRNAEGGLAGRQQFCFSRSRLV